MQAAWQYATAKRPAPTYVTKKSLLSIYDKAVKLTNKTGIKRRVTHRYKLEQNPRYNGFHVRWNLRIKKQKKNARV